jgi:hypothetical protein
MPERVINQDCRAIMKSDFSIARNYPNSALVPLVDLNSATLALDKHFQKE